MQKISTLHQYFLINIKYLEDFRFRIVASHFLNKANLKISENDILKIKEILTTDYKINKTILKNIHKSWEKLKNNYPVDYIIRKINYDKFDLYINPGVFIPRAETEFGLNLILKKYKLTYNIIDLCAGSGFISVFLSKNLKKVNILSIDISEKSVQNIRKNITNNYIKNIKVIKNNRLKNVDLNIGKWSLFCNPPYVPQEWQDSVKFEPRRAIYSGKDGLNFFRKIIKDLENIENKPTFMCFELDPRNIETAKKMIENNQHLHFNNICIYQDQFGSNRFLVAS